MSGDPQRLRALLEERRKAIAASHRQGAGSFETCTALTSLADEAIRTAFESLAPTARDHIAILALGGYGRCELFPKSDIDVMVLCSSGEQKDAASVAARGFLHLLWDAGIDVGHSVRTTGEAMDLYGKSHEAWTSMLESRFICGNARLAVEFFARMDDRLAQGSDGWYVEGIFADIQSRYERYGNSVKLLEPNVKKSAGGLRDLHALYWLHCSADPSLRSRNGTVSPASKGFLDYLRAAGTLDEDEHAAAAEALQFLFHVRHEMHYLREGLHDTLEYALQVKVAEGLGYGSKEGPPPPAMSDAARWETRKKGVPSVEVFMRDYYLHARTLHLLNHGLTVRFREMIDRSGTVVRGGQKVSDIFILRDDVLTVDQSFRRFEDAGELLAAFAVAAEQHVEPDFRLRGAIGRSADLINERISQSPEVASVIRRILSSRRVAATFHDMNDLDILGRCIPEFGDLVAFFQHNVYHYYTADEHTLIAIGNAERLREQQGVLHEVFRNIRRRDVLYMAILLHDIAKPHGVADHEITGIEMARTILHRLGMDEMFPDVSFLVRYHLLMEQIAFRRNVHDPDTIREFTSKFARAELLDYLYVLTYADLSAVNPGVWTEWKGTMLEELYRRASDVLRRDLKGQQIDDYHHARQQAAAEQLVEALTGTLPREVVEQHLKAIPNDAYISLFTEEEIEQHIRRGMLGDPVSTIFNHTEGYTEVTVIAKDAPFTLSKFCAVLSANDANIFDANVFTRDDGVIFDRFRVTGASSGEHLEQKVCAKITEDLTAVVQGTLDIGRLFVEHRRRWKRRPKLPPNPNTRTDVEFEDNPKYTIIDVYAPDAVGFLYRVTETISRLGLDIYFAKIATRGDGIVDAFYTLDRAGKPVKGRARREGIRTEILATLRKLAEEELSA